MNIKAILSFLAILLLLYVGFEVVPILYRGIVSIRGICKENADSYHKYGSGYISTAINDALTRTGIPPEKRRFSINLGEESVSITIVYFDQADFFGRYEKDFNFSYTCEGVLKSVYE